MNETTEQTGFSRGGWMQTFSGRVFYPMAPRASDVCIEDIAHALALTCRYNGHCHSFYSVAQHSVIMSRNAMPLHAEWALFHDAAEAYVGDMIRPIKCGDIGAEFAPIEEINLIAIAEHFGLVWPMPAMIKAADLQMLATEARDLMGGQVRPWSLEGIEPLEQVIVPWTPEEAEDEFLTRFEELRGVK